MKVEKKKVSKKTLTGRVSSDKMDKTIVVTVSRKTKDQRYGKIFTERIKVKAHDERNDAKTGDKVLVEEVTRPLSRTKRWVLKEIVEKHDDTNV